MGIRATNPYTESLIRNLSSRILGALDDAAMRVDNGSANAACLRWFGQNDANFKKALAIKLRRFKSVINTNVITIGFEPLGTREAGTSARAWTAQAPIKMGQSLSQVPATRGVVELDVAFPELPRYLVKDGSGLIDVSFYNQSKFETLVHELSHALLGTADEDWNGKTAYGAERASRLATTDSPTAQNNAENWGIFVEACGLNKSR